MKAQNIDKAEGDGDLKESNPDGDVRASFSKAVLKPSVSCAQAITALNSNNRLGGTDLVGLDGETIQQCLVAENERIRNGDLSRVEAMLIDQAHSLQMMSNLFTMKISKLETIEQVEVYTRLALKSQNQCRQTLATLIEMKNPRRSTFIKQQNNAVNQQINNGASPGIETDPIQQNPKNSEISTNELFEVEAHEQLDTRAQSAAGGANSQLETVEEIDRPKNRSGKAKGKPEFV